MSTASCSSFVPSTYNTSMVHLHFDDARKAIQWYVDVMGATQRRLFETPDKKHVMHAELQLGDTVIMLSDAPMPPGMLPGPSNATFYTYVPDVDAQYASALKHGATARMAPTDAFYGDRMGTFIDPFGNQWTVAKVLQPKSDAEIRSTIEDRAKAGTTGVGGEESKCCSGEKANAPHLNVTLQNSGLEQWKKMSHIHHVKEADRKPKQIVSESEWEAVLKDYHLADKALTHHKDYVTYLRQQLPWTEIRADYVFEDIHGKKFTLQELFTNPKHDDLIIYNMMLPMRTELNNPCPMCASWCDQINGNLFVLQQKTNVAITAKGPPALLADFAKRRGWSDKLPLFSGYQCTFQEDLGWSLTSTQYEQLKKVHEEVGGDNMAALKKMQEINPDHPWVLKNFGFGLPLLSNVGGTLVLHFDRKTNKVYKTFKYQSRGAESINAAFNMLDLLPYGREGFMPTV